MSIYHPHPHLQTWPPFQASWIPPPLPPQLTGDTFVHNAYLTPSLPLASQAFKCYNNRPSPLPGWPRPHCPPSLPTPTYFPNLPFPVELGELFIDFISD